MARRNAPATPRRCKPSARAARLAPESTHQRHPPSRAGDTIQVLIRRTTGSSLAENVLNPGIGDTGAGRAQMFDRRQQILALTRAARATAGIGHRRAVARMHGGTVFVRTHRPEPIVSD